MSRLCWGACIDTYAGWYRNQPSTTFLGYKDHAVPWKRQLCHQEWRQIAQKSTLWSLPFFLLKLLFSSVHDSSTFGYLSFCSLSVYQINRQEWEKLHVSVAITDHTSSPKLFNCCHARRWELIIASCIFISFEKLPTNCSRIFVKAENWNILTHEQFFSGFPFPVSVLIFSLWRIRSYLIAFYFNTSMEKDWLIWYGLKR